MRRRVIWPCRDGKGESRRERYIWSLADLAIGFLYIDRFLGFLACLAGSAICFFVAFLTLPIRTSYFAQPSVLWWTKASSL